MNRRMPIMKKPAEPHSGVAPEIAGMLGEMLELAMILRRAPVQAAARLSSPFLRLASS